METYTAVIEDYFEVDLKMPAPITGMLPWPKAIFGPAPIYKPGLILPPLKDDTIKKPKDDESDEVLDLAIKIVADRQRMKHKEKELLDATMLNQNLICLFTTIETAIKDAKKLWEAQ
jgi:hypothetical protein